MVYSVTIQSTGDNPFEMAATRKEWSALEKLRFALKLSLGPQVDVAAKGDLQKTIYDPIVFKSNIFLHQCHSPLCEEAFLEGNKDGSLSVAYPKHMPHVVALVFDEWISPAIYQMPEQKFCERLCFLEQFGERLGVPVLDDEPKQMLLQNYRYCKMK